MNKKIQHFIDELAPNSKNVAKMSRVFQGIEDIGKDIHPDPKFKLHLGKRLENLIEIQSMTYQVEKRRWYLFGGTFASFLFLGVFLYYISTTFFSTPFSQEIKNIQAPKIQEQETLLRDILPKNNSRIQESLSIDSELPPADTSTITKKQSVESVGNSETQVVSESQIVPESVEERQTESQEESNSEKTEETVLDNGDSSSVDTSLISPSSTLEEVSVSEENGQDIGKSLEDFQQFLDHNSPVETSVEPFGASMMMDADVDTFLGDEPEEKTINFKEYCREIGGVYVRIEPLQECHKDNQVCTLESFNKSLSCSFEQSEIETDLEIDLEEVINEYENQ